jgi:hypothetical protein
MCNNGFAQNYAVMAGKYGKEAANALYKAFDAGVDMVEWLVEEERIDCGFARVGKLKLAAKPEHYDYSMGYSGHGTHMSTLMGSVMAEVMDGHPDLNPWKDFGWPAIPSCFGRPWFLPILGAYYRLKDLVT